MGLKAFLRRFQVEYLLRVLKDAFLRFPLSVLACAAGAAVSILAVHDVKLLSDNHLQRLMFFLQNAAVFFAAVRLFVEGARMTRRREMAITVPGGALLLALAFVPAHVSSMHLFIVSAISLSMLVAPYIGRRSSEDSVWFYNYTNGVSLAVSVVSAVILCLGLCAIVGSMDYLIYDMRLSKLIYADIWIFGAMFFGPVMLLHQLSRQFDFEEGECVPPRGVYFIANYIVIPLILIYMWVLYAYFLKIAAKWELPKGNLAYMVTGFGSLGVAARLAVFPMRDNGIKLLQQFYRHFYFILIVPIVLLAIGLYTRLSQYGVTADRYAIGICLAWLAALTAWNIGWKEKAHLKHAPMVLAALFIAASFGPWGADSLSVLSQRTRLEGMLVQAGVLAPNGAIAKTNQNVPFDLRKDISAELDYFFSGREGAIQAWTKPFTAEIQKVDKNADPTVDHCSEFLFCSTAYGLPEKVMEAWGMRYVSPYQRSDDNYVYLWGQTTYVNGAIRKIAPYTYMLDVSTGKPPWELSPVFKEDGIEKLKVKLALTPEGDFSLTLPDGRAAHFDLRAVGETFNQRRISAVPEADAERLILHSDKDGLKVELRITNLGGRMADGHLILESGSMTVLFAP